MPLEERRGFLSLKFAKNCLKNEEKKFPLKKRKHAMNVRKSDKFYVKSANIERYKTSIPFLQRQLNNENNKMKIEMGKFLSGDSKRKLCK